MSESALTVPEMSCEACRSTVAGALGQVDGVDAVDVDLETNRVTVRHRTDVSKEELVGAVEEQGYEVAEAA
jgi:copper chaperone